MSPETQQLLETYGIDVKRTLARFVGNEEMLLMFLRELKQDETMAAILSARQSGDQQAFNAAVHSLKGLSGNLGLTPLYETTAKLMDALRAQNGEEAERLYPLMLAEFDRAVQMTQNIPGE